MASSDQWPDPRQMIPDLLRASPQARTVLDRYGLRGCGGAHGPCESLEFFARAHDVPLDRLLAELSEAVRTPANAPGPEFEPPAEQLADNIYRPFFRSGIAVVLTLGAAWGAWLLWRIGQSGSFTSVGLHEVNAHGHAQIFGWVGLFVMGFAYQALPRFKHTALSHPRLAYASLWLMLGGLVGRSMLEPLVSWWPMAGVPAVASSVAEIMAVGIFVGVIVATLRSAAKGLEFYDYYVLAALGWFFVQAVYEAIYFAATLTVTGREPLLRLVATWQGPLREIQIHGFAMLMILGVSQRMFHYFYGFPAPSRRKSVVALVVLNLAVVGEVLGLILMAASHRAWAALWYASVLALAAAAAVLVLDWRLASRPEESDRSLKFLRMAYLWLFLSLAMLVFLPVYQFLLLPVLAPGSRAASMGFSHAYYGAIRHAITVGFISLMIMGVAAKVVPTLRGIDVRQLPGLWIPFVLLNTGCAIRVFGQTMTDLAPAAFPVTGASGVLELTALAVWGVHVWRLMSQVSPAEVHSQATSCAGRPALVTLAPSGTPAIEPDQTVADVLERYPWLLETFVAAGFTPLRNPVLRRTLGRMTTIRKACRHLGVDLNCVLNDLNHQRSKPLSFPS